jgi:hypothetical protein
VIAELLRAFVHALMMRELQVRLRPGQYIVDASYSVGAGLIVMWSER